MRIAWIGHDTARDGGAELALVDAVKALKLMQHEVHIVIPAAGPYAALVHAAGADVTTVRYAWWIARRDWRSPYRRAQRAGRNALATAQLTRQLAHLQPDVVVTNTLARPVGAIAARIARIPHVWYIHEYVRSDHAFEFDIGERASLWLVNRLSRRVITPSAALRDAFSAHLLPSQVVVVHPFISVPPAEPTPTPTNDGQTLRIVIVGRIAEGKGQEDAVRAMSFLVAQGIDAELTLVGREMPDYGQRLRQLAVELGVAPRIRFAG